MGNASIGVLVVDDHEPWRRFFSSKLQTEESLQVLGEASDGLEAVQKAQELQPDLILLDIGIPTLNGIEAARQIREVSPAAKILFVSENRSVEIAKEALRTGACGYVVKSDAASELWPAIKAVLEGNRFVSTSLAGLDLSEATDKQSSDHPCFTGTVTPPQPRTGIGRRHEAAFYADDVAFVDGFARFIEGALRHGSPAILVATAPHRKSLFQRLKADGLDVDTAIAQGMYIPLDVPDTLQTFMVNDLPDPVRFVTVAGDLITEAAKAAKGERRHVVACGECAPVLLEQGNAEAAIRLEHLWDEIARSYDVDILCGYVSSASPRYESDKVFQRICAEHSAIQGQEIAH